MKRSIFILLAFILALNSCNEEEVSPEPTPDPPPSCKPCLDLNFTMFFAASKSGMTQYLYANDALSSTILTYNEDVCHNEAFDTNDPCFTTQESVWGGSIKTVTITSIFQNTATLKKCNITDFSPTQDDSGNSITIKSNNKQAPYNYTMEDLYSPNNVWDFDSNKWFKPELKGIFIKLVGFESADKYVTKLGYQIAIDDAPQPNGILTLIGTGYNGLLGDDLSCKSPLNAISLYSITIDQGKKLYLNLRNESEEEIFVNVVFKNQDEDTVNWIANKQILSSYSETTTSPFIYDLSTLDIDNNCYTIEITKAN